MIGRGWPPGRPVIAAALAASLVAAACGSDTTSGPAGTLAPAPLQLTVEQPAVTVNDTEIPAGQTGAIAVESQIVLGEGAIGLLDAGDDVRFELFKSTQLRPVEVSRLEIGAVHDLGHVHAVVADDADARLTLTTSSGVVLTTRRSGTAFTVCQAATGSTCLHVDAGEVEWEAQGATEIYRAGQGAFAEMGDPPSPPRCVAAGEVADWFAGARRNEDPRPLSAIVDVAPPCDASPGTTAVTTTIADDRPPVDLAALEDAVFVASGFPRSVVRPALDGRTVVLTGWLFDEAARPDIIAAAGVPGVDGVLDQTELMAPDQLCTDAIRAQSRWVCLFDATFDGATVRAEYVGTPDFDGDPWSIESIHLHFFDDDVPVAGAGTPGPVSDGSGTWKVWDDPRVFTGTPAEIGTAPAGTPDRLCVRVADGSHTLVSPDGGNCWPIAATG